MCLGINMLPFSLSRGIRPTEELKVVGSCFEAFNTNLVLWARAFPFIPQVTTPE